MHSKISSYSTTNLIDTKPLKARIGNRWPQIFEDLAEELYEAVESYRGRNKHVTCPFCGKDNFRLFPDADRTGGVVCTCRSFSDGIGVLEALKGWSFPETVAVLEEWLNDQGDSDEFGERGGSAVRDPGPPVRNEWAVWYIDRILASVSYDHQRLVDYYRSRGLSVKPSPYLGFGMEHYKDDLEDDYFPTMYGFFQAPDDEVVCVLRTSLDPDGSGKADVESPKKFSTALFRGALNGAAIRLRDCRNTVAVAEGIETAEAIYQATGMPAWACGCANGLEKFIPPPGIRNVAIWADRDNPSNGKPGAGQAAGARLALRLYELGLAVKLMIPPTPKVDWLDILLAEGEERLRAALHNTRPFRLDRPGLVPPPELELMEVRS